MSCKSGVVAIALILAGAGAASAQTGAAQKGDASGTEGNLSSKLSKSGGVITPNAEVDPNMKVPAPAPHPNSTPVIPPSATGGNTAK